MNVSKVGFGCVTFGREIDEATSHQLLDYACEHGITFFDTASAYAEGASESIIGSWLSSRQPDRESSMIATKLLPPYEPDRILKVVKGSLERLGVRKIELLYLHSWNETAETIECLAALDALVQEGTVGALGVSNFSRDQLEQCLALQDRNRLARFRVIQNNFNFAVSDMDLAYREFCQSENVKVVTYSPLGAGFLTGKHKQSVEPGSRFDIIPGHQNVYFHEHAWRRLARLEEVAEGSGYDQAQLALAWAMHQPGIDSVLVGGRTTTHLDQALAARDFGDFEVLAELNVDSSP